MKKKSLRERTQFFARQFAQFSQSFWYSEQVFTDSITETQT